MLPKKNRADRKDLEEVFKKGLFLNSPNFSFKYFKKNKEENDKDFKISFIIPKTVTKSAIKRNSLRRKGYSLLLKHRNLLKKPIVGAFIFNKKSINNTTQELEHEIKNILDKLN